jgi:hypothetical protein
VGPPVRSGACTEETERGKKQGEREREREREGKNRDMTELPSVEGKEKEGERQDKEEERRTDGIS